MGGTIIGIKISHHGFPNVIDQLPSVIALASLGRNTRLASSRRGS
jgi:hypothetical protein